MDLKNLNPFISGTHQVQCNILTFEALLRKYMY